MEETQTKAEIRTKLETNTKQREKQCDIGCERRKGKLEGQQPEGIELSSRL